MARLLSWSAKNFSGCKGSDTQESPSSDANFSVLDPGVAIDFMKIDVDVTKTASYHPPPL